MAVYVDESIHSYRQMKMCHMMSESLEELHEMADIIGINRKWFQKDSKYPHYDICKSKRKLAVEWGAIEVTTRELILMVCKSYNV